MDSEYLKRTVGEALVLGLTEVAVVRPADTIDFLANFLLKHCDNLELAKKREDERTELEVLRAQHEARIVQAAKMKAEEKRRMAVEAQNRAKFEEEKRLSEHRDNMSAYEAFKRDLEKNLNEERVMRKKVAVPLSSYKKAKLRLEALRAKLSALDRSLLEELKGYTPETHVHEIKIVRAVLLLLGHSLETALSWEKVLAVMGRRGTSEIVRRMMEFRPTRRVRLSRLQLAASATKGLDLSDVATSNYAIYLFFDWLDTCVDVRNERIAAALEAGDDVAPEERAMFRVGEAGKAEAFNKDNDSGSEFEAYNGEESEESVPEEDDDEDDDDDGNDDGNDDDSSDRSR